MRFALAAALLTLAACAAPADVVAPRVPPSPTFAVTVPTGLVVDGVAGLTVTAHWDAVADANGYYLVLSAADDVNASKKYQIVYGGGTTSGAITAYDAGCYLVSVFGWSLSDDDSAWITVGPVEVGGACPASVLNAKRKGHKK